MSILSFVSNRGGLACDRAAVFVSIPCGEWSKVERVSCSRNRRTVRRISACAAPAAPCQSFEAASSPVLGRVEFGGVAFESRAFQTLMVDGLVFQQARSPELLRAAAYLRAVSFYSFPEGRSEEAVQLHRKMKVADEFSALKSKVAGLQQGYKRIVCILALYPLSRLADSSVVKLHPSLKVTLDNGEEHVLVGSLDLNQGIALPGESAVKKVPEMSASFNLARTTSSVNLSTPSRRIQAIGGNLRERGYLSNVCVAPLMRQRGIGTALLQQAQAVAQLWGIKNLYVHAVSTNEAAVKLYNKVDFTVEKEEVAPIARREVPEFTTSFGRIRQVQPRRLLLHKFI